MDQKLEQIEHLLSLFDEREQARLEINHKIVHHLAPSTLSAVIELMDVSADDIQWEDIRIVDTILLVVFSVTYDPSTTRSLILKKVKPTTSDGAVPIEVQQMLHLSLPLAMAFDDKEMIKDFLLKAFAEPEPSVEEPSPVQDPEVPVDSALTKEQVRQMLYFQQQTKGIKQ